MPMDVYSHIGLSSSTDNINNVHALCMNTHESAHGILNVLSVDELSVDVTKFLNIEDTREDDSSLSPPHKSYDFQKKDVFDKSHKTEITSRAPEKSLGKCAAFPSSSEILSTQDAKTNEILKYGDTVKNLDPSSFRSTSMPAHLKPVSAMKGSREKRGVTPPVKLTVKWAPDVYDPIPTSVSHVVTNNRSSRHSKKNSRNKQKNGSKSSRGSKSKDKKQVRKRGGSSFSGMGYKLEHEEEEEEVVVDFRGPELGPLPAGVDFQVGNSDQLCGSSFMKRYGTNLHLSSVAEAT